MADVKFDFQKNIFRNNSLIGYMALKINSSK